MKVPSGWQKPSSPSGPSSRSRLSPTSVLEMATIRPARRYDSPSRSTAATASRRTSNDSGGVPPLPDGRGGIRWARRAASQASTCAGNEERGQYDKGTRPPGRLENLADGLVPVNVRPNGASRTPSMSQSVLTIGHATSAFLTGGGGEPIPAIPGMRDPADHGMQGVRGSNPLSSTLPDTAIRSSAGDSLSKSLLRRSDPQRAGVSNPSTARILTALPTRRLTVSCWCPWSGAGRYARSQTRWWRSRAPSCRASVDVSLAGWRPAGQGELGARSVHQFVLAVPAAGLM
jgi:hypothetical protein